MRIWKLSTVALAIALATVVASGRVNTASADAQPVMQKALGNLQEALKNLQNASEDKGGHRVKAIEFTQKAIEQVEKGMKFDTKHDSGKKER
jgi:ABC-type glycerol-3-phosphate transport system substrate-binding protein